MLASSRDFPLIHSLRSTIEMNCPTCGTALRAHSRFCPGCDEDVGYPNVRLAETSGERNGLGTRLAAAEVSAQARGCLNVLTRFGLAVLGSKAVIARELGLVDSLMKSDNQLYISYHRQVKSGSRLPEENSWDRGRVAAESTVLPLFYEDINFAALSLDGRGVPEFGRYSIVLREPMIARRTTVFEENPFSFCQRFRIVAGDAAPEGDRATWSERYLLAKAKLQPKISAATRVSDFPGVLLAPNPATGTDFMKFTFLDRSTVRRSSA
jgi:hypothetical protein